jgi:hypothetical protein
VDTLDSLPFGPYHSEYLCADFQTSGIGRRVTALVDAAVCGPGAREVTEKP